MRPLIFALCLLGMPALAAEPLRIAVASNFKPVLERLNAEFTAATGIQVRLSSASSGVLATQILHGAPFDVFFSADRERPAQLIRRGIAAPAAAFCYASGVLALVGGQFPDLARPELRVAIANPLTAPYGEAALEVLARADYRSGAARTVVRGNNAAQAYQFWYSGAADLALIPLAIAPEGALPIPREWHKPLLQYALVLGESDALARYLKWIRSDTVRSTITNTGYDPCP
ncbi:MAG: molybdate ABC transporter substrate-binding protein [Halioglobus sp.]